MSGKIGELRPSQFVSTFGPGAIMDLPEMSAIVAGLDQWNLKLCTPINEPRLKEKLKLKKGIKSLPIPLGDDFSGTLPAYRFPRFLVCPRCRRLDLYDAFAGKSSQHALYCYHHGTTQHGEPEAKVFPARFMVACPAGHISDFPWHSYVHKGRQCANSKLFLEEEAATGAISDVTVRCETCNTSRTLADAFGGDPKSVGACEGRRQWLGPNERQHCEEKPRAMLRGASNAYFPIVFSALSIPPAIHPVNDAVAEVQEALEGGATLDQLRGFLAFRPDLEDYSAEAIYAAWQEQSSMAKEAGSDLYLPEWNALLKGSQSNAASDFLTRKEQVPPNFTNLIDNLIQVHRLREVRVIAGFTRINPPPDPTTVAIGDPDTEEGTAGWAPLARRNPGWLPGVVVRGEGIFIALNEDAVADWEKQAAVDDHAQYMSQEYDRYCSDRKLKEPSPFPGARYVLLHSLAHALMRQLGLNSGYSSTALRERIYCRNEKEHKMAGILIYTATPDSEGSMGGLVEQGETYRFGETLWRALQEARYCSGDPLCAEHQPQHTGELNGAACHACQFAAETSCERANLFLDRSFLVPTVSRANLAFFKDCV